MDVGLSTQQNAHPLDKYQILVYAICNRLQKVNIPFLS